MAVSLKQFLAIGVVMLTTATLAWAGSDAQPKAGGAPKPLIHKAVKGTQCVEDTDYMRRNHMKVLDGHRDKTVIEGIRTTKHSLKECISCHVSEKTGSVAASKDDFCVSCHSYASVKIDCFECHSTKPQGSIALHPLNAGTAHLKHKLVANTKIPANTAGMAGVKQ